MQTVHKYPFAILDKVVIPMPQNAGIMTIKTQNETPCIWAIVDTEGPLVDRTFRIFGTGQPIPTGLRMHYLGSVKLQGGALVFHVFEEQVIIPQ